MEDKNYYNYLTECGFSKEEIELKILELKKIKELYFNGDAKEKREITSSTYKREINRNKKEIDNLYKKR